MEMEARLLEAAGRASVPVPEVVVASDDAELLGSPFVVMRRVAGETIPRKILRDDEYAAVRPTLARRCGAILAGIHSIPVDEVSGLADETEQLGRWRDVLDSTGQAHPTFELAFRWLAERRPAARPATVVHGDFRNGNLIVGPDGVRAVLDWELAHIGDPVEDLGWLCAKPWRFGSAAPVGGFGGYDDLLRGYAEAGGRDVSPAEVVWWATVGTLKWGIMCILQALAHTSGAVRSVELAAIGRRVCETEWDLLQAMDTG